MQNKTLISLARKLLSNLISKCSKSEQGKFKRIYSHKDREKPMAEIIKTIDSDCLDNAISLVERTIEKHG